MKRIFVSIVLLTLASLACGIRVRATAPELAPATEEAIIRQYVEGRTVVVFGDEQFVANAKADAEAVGMIALTALSLNDAVVLAGDSIVEFHCLTSGGQVVVVQASHPSKIFWDGEHPITECASGAILVGFYTDESPDITAP